MELRSIPSPAVSSIPRKGLIKKPCFLGQVLKSPCTNKYPVSRKLFKPAHYKVQASGTIKLGSQLVETVSKDVDLKDKNLVFVAGATGKVGSRTVRELLKLGFKVRAGVRNVQRAESLVKSVQQLRLDPPALEQTTPIEKLELVECDLEIKDQIGPALSNASTVICCIGASEKEVFDVTGPYRIDYQATKNLIDTATVAKVRHFILLTSLGTNKVGFPAAILNLFWGVLIWKRKAEEALLASGIPYTIVRPGGMERPTDSYKETHNVTLSPEDTLFGGQVSNLQVAELLAFMAKDRSLSYCKVVEVIAETTAQLTPFGELLAKIPSQRAEVYPLEEPGAGNGPEPVSKSSSSETPIISAKKEPAQSKPVSTRPLSPYIAYEDLKPPVSPTPKTPGGSKEVNIVETVPEPTSIDSEASTKPATISSTDEPKSAAIGLEITQPLSPYTAYEDLKPPTSPSPTPSGSREIPSSFSASAEVAGNDVAKAEDVISLEKDPPQAPASNHHSPYNVYGDLKPPTSPTPSSPNNSFASAAPTYNGSQVIAMPVNSSPHAVPKSMPLSPFTMYEDLKPPSSPTPRKE